MPTLQRDPATGLWIPFDPGAKRSPIDIRDYQLAAVHPEIAERARAVEFGPKFSLSSKCLPIEDQNPKGACTAFGSGRAHEITQATLGGTPFKGSKAAQYYWTRLLEGTQDYDNGAYVRDAAKALAQRGYAHDALFTYGNPVNVAPGVEVATDAAKYLATQYVAVPNDVASIKAVLTAGFGVIVGFTVYTSFFNPVNGIIQQPSGRVEGGHCVVITGWDDTRAPQFGTCWEFPNSWGTAWALAGWAFMPQNILQMLGSDFWMISAVMGVTPAPTPPAPTTKHVIQINTYTVSEAVYSDGTRVRNQSPTSGYGV